MHNIINDLRNTSGTKAKIEYIKNLDSVKKEELKQVLLAAMTPNVSYNFEVIPEYETKEELYSLQDGLEKIKPLQQSIDENRDDYLTEILSHLSAENAGIVEMVIRDKINIGLKNKSLKAVYDDFPQPHPYNRCSSFSQKNISNLTFPLICQTKEDGMYIDFIKGKSYTRAGNVVDIVHEDVVNYLTANASDYVIQGELLQLDESGKRLSRQESNGLSNRKEVDSAFAQFVVFDMVDVTDFENGLCKTPYEKRLEMLTDLVNNFNNPHLKLVDTDICDTIDDVIVEFKERLKNDEEGCVLKDKKAVWKNGTNKHFVKMKIECTSELKVVGFEHGAKGTKYEKMLGSLIVESSDGKVKFNVGSGFTDELREDPSQFLDKVIEVRYNDIVQNKDEPDFHALYLPRFIRVREDKTEADSYDKIVESLNAVDDVVKNIFEKEE